MASDIAHAIVARARDIQIREEAERSHVLVLQRGSVKCYAKFRGNGPDNVHITLSLNGSEADALSLMYKRTEVDHAYECCGQLLLSPLWYDSAQFTTNDVTACIVSAGAPTNAMIQFRSFPRVDIYAALINWRFFQAQFKTLMHIC